MIFLFSAIAMEAQPRGKGAAMTVAGLIVSGKDGGMSVRNSEGQFEVEWTKATRVAREKKAKEKK